MDAWRLKRPRLARGAPRPAAALALCVLMSSASIGAVQAQTDPIPALADRENVVLSTDNDDMQFLAGRTVTVTARVPDDIFAAGRDIVFQDAAAGTAIVAGATVTLNGGTTADLIAAAEDRRAPDEAARPHDPAHDERGGDPQPHQDTPGGARPRQRPQPRIGLGFLEHEGDRREHRHRGDRGDADLENETWADPVRLVVVDPVQPQEPAAHGAAKQRRKRVFPVHARAAAGIDQVDPVTDGDHHDEVDHTKQFGNMLQSQG